MNYLPLIDKWKEINLSQAIISDEKVRVYQLIYFTLTYEWSWWISRMYAWKYNYNSKFLRSFHILGIGNGNNIDSSFLLEKNNNTLIKSFECSWILLESINQRYEEILFLFLTDWLILKELSKRQKIYFYSKPGYR